MDYFKKIIGEIEVHSIEGIRTCFENGVSPNDLYNGLPLIDELTSEYLRSNRFSECVKLFLEYGMKFEDKILLSVLLNDSKMLESHLKRDPSLVSATYNLKCAFTPLQDASLMHICAEFNHLESAEILVRYGSDINAVAGKDEYGLGGQTPIFHTVNQILNHSKEMLDWLIEKGADLHYTVKGFVWGKGYEWETLIPAVNPISYAMMGLLPQLHRKDIVISTIVLKLMEAAYGIEYPLRNVPNAYLRGNG